MPDGDGPERRGPDAGGETEAILAAFEHSPLLLAVFEGHDLRRTAANAAARILLGESVPPGAPFLQARSDLVEQGWWSRLAEVRRTGRPGRARAMTVHLVTDAGVEARCLDFSFEPWHDRSGGVRGVLAYGVDVSGDATLRRFRGTSPAAVAQREGRAHELVVGLQDALLPGELPVMPTVKLAARYLLADSESTAGGDWFDAIPLPDGRVALVVGDVVGRGVGASAVMGRLQTVLRERLASGVGLASAVQSVDRFAEHLPGGAGATVCVAEMSPQHGEMSFVCCGHPPPLLVSADGSHRFVTSPSGGRPLGTGATYELQRDHLDDDQLLVLYSDGIVDRPGISTEASNRQLVRVAASALATADSVDATCGRVLSEMVTDGAVDDDVTLLVARRCDAPDDLVLDLPAEEDAARVARDRLRAWLDLVGARALDQMAVQHAVGEVLANAVLHSQSTEVHVRASLRDDGMLEVTVGDRGSWREAANRPGGRGLAVAGGLVDRLRVRRGGPDREGTVVTITHRVSHDVPVLLASDPLDEQPSDPHPGDVRPGMEVSAGRLRVAGPLDWSNRDLFRVQLRRASSGGAVSTLVDLSEVTFIASAAVQTLFEASRDAVEQGSELTVVAPLGSPAQQVLSLVSLPHQATALRQVDHPPE